MSEAPAGWPSAKETQVASVTKLSKGDRFDAEEPAGDRRGFARTMLQRPGTLRMDDAPVASIHIADLTRDGCRIEAAVHLDPWQAVTIGIPGVGQHMARIMWSRDGLHGCAFERPLPSGAVTAAMDDNVHHLAPNGDLATPTASKASPRYRAVLFATMILASGAVLFAAGRALLG